MMLLDFSLAGFAVFVRLLLVAPFTIPSVSMVPTLKIGDYLLVSKSAYGYTQFPLPLGFGLPAFSLLRKAPKRGDVIVFNTPRDLSVTYVKRVIGLAGDRVQITNGVVTLNGKPLPRTRIGDYRLEIDTPAAKTTARYRETLPDGIGYDIIEMSDGAAGDNTTLFTVPPGHCFVMGDNRDMSNDSRFDLGYVPYADIIAKALITVDYHGSALKAHAVR
jgi:signal peptidase I